jgi:hypothetical protein
VTGSAKPNQPWLASDGAQLDARRYAPATLRNRDHILPILRKELPTKGTVLEIASGSGEHIVYFANALPNLRWVPSDPDLVALASITAHLADASLANVYPPVIIDAAAEQWPEVHCDAVLCINMIHISPWSATVGLFAHATNLLRAGAPVIIYGPFIEEGLKTADSNMEFDQSLRDRNVDWGLRHVSAIDSVAAAQDFVRTRRIAMPANNLMLIWRRS